MSPELRRFAAASTASTGGGNTRTAGRYSAERQQIAGKPLPSESPRRFPQIAAPQIGPAAAGRKGNHAGQDTGWAMRS
jgi:hypothetical protein